MKCLRAGVLAFALLVAGGGAGPAVLAWGNDGHQIVCGIAYRMLSTSDRQEVDRLTRLYRTPDNGRYQFFTNGCTFPDLARSQARSNNPAVVQRWQRFAQFDNWHFLNLARTDRVVNPQVCANDCVLHGIEHHVNLLDNHSLPDMQRAEALLFLGHWMGDVHQPLHVSYKNDLGGNDVKPITGFYAPIGHLHGVWDSGIVSRAQGSQDWWTFSGQLRSQITPQLQQTWSAVPVKDWAQESYDITTKAETVYCRVVGNQCRSIAGGRHLTASYQTAFGEAVKLRLQKGGARLATLIQQALH